MPPHFNKGGHMRRKKRATGRGGPLVLTITIPPGEPRAQFRDLCVVLEATNAAMKATAEKLNGSNHAAVNAATSALGVRRRGR
jgi:hypothetical protein